MNIAIERIVDIVSLRLGEYPDWRLLCQQIEAGEHCPLREMVEVLVEETAQRLTRSLPLAEFASPVDLRSEIYSGGEVEEEGADLVCQLPDDFCRLHALKFTGWPTVLSDENPGDRQILALGGAAPGWLTHRRRRPWLRITNLGEKGYMLTCSMERRAWPEEAAYIPLPVYDKEAGVLQKADPAIIKVLAEEIAEAIRGN